MDPLLHERDRLVAEQSRRDRATAAKRRSDRLTDDLLLFATTQNGGCLLLLGAALLALGVGSAVVFAQEVVPTYPQAAYMQNVSMYGGAQTIALQSGRWEVRLITDDCVSVMLAASQVWLTAPIESPAARVYVVAYGDQARMECDLDPALRIRRDPTPCATRNGLCDGNREPKPEWWELP